LFGGALADEIGRRAGAAVEMMHVRHGVFDDATISVITSDTVDEVSRMCHCRRAGRADNAHVVDIGWKAQVRLCKRFRRLVARGKHPNVAVTAIARELIAFMWAIAKQAPIAAVRGRSPVGVEVRPRLCRATFDDAPEIPAHLTTEVISTCRMSRAVSERSNAATVERLKSGHCR
jgi:hypothetical protein